MEFQEGDEHDIDIVAMGAKGDGIAKIEGFTVFVPDTKMGDRLRIKITKVMDRFGFGEVI